VRLAKGRSSLPRRGLSAHLLGGADFHHLPVALVEGRRRAHWYRRLARKEETLACRAQRMNEPKSNPGRHIRFDSGRGVLHL
jgi:hypothetical protein